MLFGRKPFIYKSLILSRSGVANMWESGNVLSMRKKKGMWGSRKPGAPSGTLLFLMLALIVVYIPVFSPSNSLLFSPLAKDAHPSFEEVFSHVSSTLSPAAITEIFPDSSGDDLHGEFVEVTWLGPSAENVSISISDGDGSFLQTTVPELDRWDVVVFHPAPGKNTSFRQNATLLGSDVSWTAHYIFLNLTRPFLNNNGDDITLAVNGSVCDWVGYGSGTAVDPPPTDDLWDGEYAPCPDENRSISRIPVFQDTNTSADWSETVPTPGVFPERENDSPPVVEWFYATPNPQPGGDFSLEARAMDDNRVLGAFLVWSNSTFFLNRTETSDGERSLWAGSFRAPENVSGWQNVSLYVYDDVFQESEKVFSRFVSDTDARGEVTEFVVPGGGGGWVEVHNPTSRPLCLLGWSLSFLFNSTGANLSLPETFIPPGGLGVFNISFSITAEIPPALPFEIRLLDEKSAAVWGATFPFFERGVPWALVDIGGGSGEGGSAFSWRIISNATPGAPNPISGEGMAEGEVLFVSVFPHVRGWEFLWVENTGSTPINMASWRVTNLWDTWFFPGCAVEPGESVVVCSSATNYSSEMGMWETERDDVVAVFEMGATGERIFSRNEAGLYLFSPNGALMDAFAWGTHNVKAGWVGESVDPGGDVGVERYFVRTGGDTDTAADWSISSARVVGQTDFPVVKANASTLTAFVSPDSGLGVLLSAISSARETINVSMYEITHPLIAGVLINASECGVKVRVLLEGQPVGWSWGGKEGTTELGFVADLVESGGEVRFVRSDGSVPFRGERYDYVHTKYAVFDGQRVFLGTENWKPTGFPVENSSGNRGWGVLVDSERLASFFNSVFFTDWAGAGDSVEFGNAPYLPPDMPANYSFNPGFRRPSVFPAVIVSAAGGSGIRVEGFVSPDATSRFEPVLRLCENASSEILIDLLDLDWHGPADSGIVADVMNAMFNASERGVSVRILLDSRYVRPDDEKWDNGDTAKAINAFASEKGLDVECRLISLGEKRLSKIHAKAMVVDRRHVLISSMNWNNHSPAENREAGLIIHDPLVGSFFRSVFMWDWSGGVGLPGISKILPVEGGQTCLSGDLFAWDGEVRLDTDGDGFFESAPGGSVTVGEGDGVFTVLVVGENSTALYEVYAVPVEEMYPWIQGSEDRVAVVGYSTSYLVALLALFSVFVARVWWDFHRKN